MAFRTSPFRRRLALAVVAGLGLTAVATGPVSARPAPDPEPAAAAEYRVLGPRTLADRNAVARTGAAIDSAEHGVLYVTATRSEAAAITRLGFRLERETTPAPAEGAGAYAFPPADSNYHNYAEMTAEINTLVADHPAIAQQDQHRQVVRGPGPDAPVKICDNVATDEDEPEVLFNAHQHAREHLTVEMALYLLNLFTDSYGTDSRITNMVNSREIWIVPDVNPDGGEYDIATGSYRSWRKNRQPNSGSSTSAPTSTATGPTSGAAAAARRGTTVRETYRGPSAVLRARRPRACATSSTAGSSAACSRSRPTSTSTPTRELVLWPFGYTHRQHRDRA